MSTRRHTDPDGSDFQPARNGWIARAKAIKELGSAGVLALLLVFLVYHMIHDILPNLRVIPQIEAAMQGQAKQSGEIVRVLRLQCRALSVLARTDPERCSEVPHGQ